MKDNAHIWYIILGLIVVMSAVGTLAFLYYTTNYNDIPPQALTTQATPQGPSQTATRTVTASPTPGPTQDPTIQALKRTDTEDTLESIEKDLNDTNLDGLDAELTKIEEALQ